jgi:predicted DNA-binding protein with PD1-like motif
MEYGRFGGVIIARIDKGEEIIESLKTIIKAEKIALGSVSAIGAVGSLKAGLFLSETKTYRVNTFRCDMEIVSLCGNITEKDGEPYLHIHISASDKDGAVVGGHLNEAVVSLTCEAVINIFDGRVTRRFSDAIGLNLLEF